MMTRTDRDSGRYDLRAPITLVTFSVIMIICSSQDNSPYNSMPKLNFICFKVAPYSFRSVSRKFCPHARLIMLHATHVVDVARVAGFLKLCRDIYARDFVGLSAGRARKLKS